MVKVDKISIDVGPISLKIKVNLVFECSFRICYNIQGVAGEICIRFKKITQIFDLVL